MTISTRRLRLLRGNSSAISGFTGLQGELVFNTDTYTLHLQDGTTAGGFSLATSAQLANITANANYGNSNVASYLASNSNIYISTSGNIVSGQNLATDNLLIGGNLITAQHSMLVSNVGGLMRFFTGNRGTGNVGIQLQANNSLSGIIIRNDSGKIGFNTTPQGPGSGYTFTFNGSVYANEFYTEANMPTGYQFNTTDGDTGLSHVNLAGNISAIRIRHSGLETVKFYSNDTTEMRGNIVVSDGVHYGQYPNAYMQVYGYANSYQQVVNQNLSNSAAASSDFVATADNGTDTTYFIDMGINSSQFASNSWFPESSTINDGYLYIVGYDAAGPSAGNIGNLYIGSTNGVVKTFIGNTSDANVVTTVSTNLLTVSGNVNANYFIGNGSLLTGISGTGNYGNSNVAAFLAAFGSNSITTTGNINANINASYVRANGLYGTTTNDTAFLSNASGLIRVLVQDNGINIQTYDHPNLNYHTWTFNSVGDLYLPSNNGGIYRANGQPYGGTDNYSNANVVAYANLGWAGNIIPAANLTYSLGNSTNYWANLWVANNTIYIGGVPLGITASNVLTVGGNQVLSNNSVSSITTTGNITANYFLGNVQGLVGSITNLDSLNLTVENISALVANNGVNIGAGGFNNLLVLPEEVRIQNVPLYANSGNIKQSGASGLTIGSTHTVYIVGDQGDNNRTWTFDGTSGDLLLPNGAEIGDDGNDIGNTELRVPDGAGGQKIWTFDANGSLSTPGNVTVNDTLFIVGSIQSFGASPAPSLSGFSSISTVISGNPNEGNITAHNYLIANGGIITTGNISAGNLNATGANLTGNINASYFIGNGSQLTGITATANYNDSNVASFLANIGSNTITTTGNITGNYFIGNGALLTGITASANYGNTNVAGFLGAYGSNTIVTTGNITAGYFIGNGSTLTGVTNYSNANAVSMLSTNTNVIIGNTNSYPLQSNITQVFIGNATALTSGGNTGPTLTNLLNNAYYDAAGALRYRNTQTGALSIALGGSSGISVGGTTGAVTANAASGMGAWLTLNGTALQTYNSINITAAGNLLTTAGVLNTGAGVSSLYNTTATTVNMGGAATTIAMGASTGTVTIGTGKGNLTVGNISVGSNITVGNVIGLTSNTTITAGSYTTTFDTVGNVTVSGNLTINGVYAGYAPARAAVRVYGNTSTNYTAGTTISNQVIDYNQGSYYSNSTGLFTAPIAGLYHCYATVRVGNNNALNQAALLKNDTLSGSNVVAFWETDTNTGTASHFSITGYAKCVAGDTLSLKVIAGNVQFDSNDSWGVTYIG